MAIPTLELGSPRRYFRSWRDVATKAYVDARAGGAEQVWALGPMVANQRLPTGGPTSLTLTFDNANGIVPGVQPTTDVVLPRDGFYLIHCHLNLSAGPAGGLDRAFLDIASTFIPTAFVLARQNIGNQDNLVSATALAYQPPGSIIWFGLYHSMVDTDATVIPAIDVLTGYWHIKWLGI